MAEANRVAVRAQWALHKLIWNLSGGRIGTKVVGMPVVEVITIGHKSGEERQVLLNYVEVDGIPIVIGSNAGRDTDPAWVRNLRANPRARARWGGRWHEVVAEELEGTARDAAWEAAVEASAGYRDYAEGMTRPIPILRLVPES